MRYRSTQSEWLLYAGGVIDVGSTDDGRILEISDDQGISISFGQRADLKSNDRPLVDLILGLWLIDTSRFIIPHYLSISPYFIWLFQLSPDRYV